MQEIRDTIATVINARFTTPGPHSQALADEILAALGPDTERDRLANTLRLRTQALDRVVTEMEHLRATVARVRELAAGPLSDSYRPYVIVYADGEVHLAVLLDDLRAALGEPEADDR